MTRLDIGLLFTDLNKFMGGGSYAAECYKRLYEAVNEKLDLMEDKINQLETENERLKNSDGAAEDDTFVWPSR